MVGLCRLSKPRRTSPRWRWRSRALAVEEPAISAPTLFAPPSMIKKRGRRRGGAPRGRCAGGAVAEIARSSVRQPMSVPVRPVRMVISTRPIDFRRGHESLAAYAQNELKRDPHSRTFRRSDPP